MLTTRKLINLEAIEIENWQDKNIFSQKTVHCSELNRKHGLYRERGDVLQPPRDDLRQDRPGGQRPHLLDLVQQSQQGRSTLRRGGKLKIQRSKIFIST